jgi:hypothetical protein
MACRVAEGVVAGWHTYCGTYSMVTHVWSGRVLCV